MRCFCVNDTRDNVQKIQMAAVAIWILLQGECLHSLDLEAAKAIRYIKGAVPSGTAPYILFLFNMNFSEYF